MGEDGSEKRRFGEPGGTGGELVTCPANDDEGCFEMEDSAIDMEGFFIATQDIKTIMDATNRMAMLVTEGQLNSAIIDMRREFETMAATGYSPAKMMIAIIDFKEGTVSLRQAFGNALDGVYRGELTQYEKYFLKTLFETAIDNGQLMLVNRDSVDSSVQGLELEDLIREVLNAKDSLHLHADLLSEVYRKLADS